MHKEGRSNEHVTKRAAPTLRHMTGRGDKRGIKRKSRVLTTSSQPCSADGVAESYASHCRPPEGDVRMHRNVKTHRENLKEKNYVEAFHDVGKHLETYCDAWSKTTEETSPRTG